MRILRLDEVPWQRIERTFRYSPWPALNFAIVCLGAGAFWIYYIQFEDGPVLLWGIVALCVLVALFALFVARYALRKKSNWLLSYSNDGVYLKYRSHRNPHFAVHDPAVVYIPFEEIERIRPIVERQERSETPRGVTQPNKQFLEIVIRNTDLRPLEDALQHERTISPPASFGVVSRSTGEPVKIVPPDTVCIEWKAKPRVTLAFVPLRAKLQRE